MNFNAKIFRLRLYQWTPRKKKDSCENLDLCLPFSILINSSLLSMSFTDLSVKT